MSDKRKHDFTTEAQKVGKRGRKYYYCRNCGANKVGRHKTGDCPGKSGA